MIFSIRAAALSIFLGLVLSGPAAAEATHTVVRGDTIFSLSRAHGVSQEELMRHNGMTDPSQLRVGMRLLIPGSQTQAAAQAPGTQGAARATHVVAPGETLFSIARSNGVTLAALREINGFSQERVLRAGERISIPFPAVVSQPPQPAPPLAAPSPQIATGRRADPSLRWPIPALEVAYMSGASGGVLVLGRESESVRSVSRGTVVYSGPWRGYGNVVIVESSGGFRFLYGANESLSVRVGDVVDTGTELGKLGLHPASGKPELVFIVSRNGLPVDPATAPRS
ncbi:MAG: M23 family metallopeptidase [Treponema sp.]|nr:M23 family metallopeptidase [Treponema sp.]